MQKPKVFIIGVGGRTGTMFAEELKESCNVFGVGLDPEINAIENRSVYIQKNSCPEIFEVKSIRNWEFKKIVADIVPDYVLLSTKNPVGPAIKYYYQIFYEKKVFPCLILSQNGLSVISEAEAALKEVMADDFSRVPIVRFVLFNAVELDQNSVKTIRYSQPVRIGYGLWRGRLKKGELKRIFAGSQIRTEEVSRKNIKNMEYSKLFLNLIGMASATKGLSVLDGFRDKKSFWEEAKVLKEFSRAVLKSGGRFLNFEHYPVRYFSLLVKLFPEYVLFLFHPVFGKMIFKRHQNKPKDFSEAAYYNGEVVKLGRNCGVDTPINEEVLARIQHQILEKKS